MAVNAIDLEKEVVPSLKLGNLLDYLNDQESGFPRKIDVSELDDFPKAKSLSDGKAYCSRVYSIVFTFKDGTENNVVVKIKEVISEICKIQALTFQVDGIEKKFEKADVFYSVLPRYLDLPLVLTHDDLWPGNMILNQDGSLGALVDFQVASPGCFAEDLANLLSMTLSGKERRIKEKMFLEFYRDELVKLLPSENQEAQKLSKMSYEDVKKVYKECQKTALFHVIMTLMNYNSQNPGDPGTSETKLEEILRCLLEDMFDEQ
ncbi:hypothetical protein FO519_007525 [Halicephalobus sp. NKZ332]|nr:hypothetical protein FO519_007525 [Halicephalobus sp. NKZ332]